jgi:hypothetical protein
MSDHIRMTCPGGGGILHLLDERWTVRYRVDINTQEKFEKYLSDRRAHLVDPFEHSWIDPIH